MNDKENKILDNYILYKQIISITKNIESSIKKDYNNYFLDNYDLLFNNDIKKVAKGNLLANIDAIENGEIVKIKDTSKQFVMKSEDGVYIGFKINKPKKEVNINDNEELISKGYYKIKPLSATEIHSLVKPFLKENKIIQKSFFELNFQEQKQTLSSLGNKKYEDIEKYYDIKPVEKISLKKTSLEQKEENIEKSKYNFLYKDIKNKNNSSQYKFMQSINLRKMCEAELKKISVSQISNIYKKENKDYSNFISSIKESLEFKLKSDIDIPDEYVKKELDQKSVPKELKKEIESDEIKIIYDSATQKIPELVNDLDINRTFSKKPNNIIKR